MTRERSGRFELTGRRPPEGVGRQRRQASQREHRGVAPARGRPTVQHLPQPKRKRLSRRLEQWTVEAAQTFDEL
jgi:hypothetical protein